MEYGLRFVKCEGCPKLKRPLPPVKKHIILSYALYPDEVFSRYDEDQIFKGELPVDPKRIKVHEVKVAERFQKRIPRRLRRLSKQLRKDEV